MEATDLREGAPIANAHMVGHRRMCAPLRASGVAGDTLAVVKNLHRAAAQSHLDFLSRQRMGYAVVVSIDVNVIIDIDPATLEVGNLIT